MADAESRLLSQLADETVPYPPPNNTPAVATLQRNLGNFTDRRSEPAEWNFGSIIHRRRNDMPKDTLGSCTFGEGRMDAWHYYLAKAAELHAKASEEKNSTLRSEFENLACSYWRLAEQAQKNSHLDIGDASQSDTVERPQDRR